MKTPIIAAAAFAMSGVLLLNQDVALAKGPLLEVDNQSPLILVKTTPTEIELKDFPWGLKEGRTENVRMTMTQEMQLPDMDTPFKISYAMTYPWIEVEKDGDDKVTVMMPEDQLIEMTMNAEGEDVTFNIEAVSEDMVMTFERDGDRMSYTGTAKEFNASVSSPQAKENGVDFTYTLGGKGLSIEGTGAVEQNWTDIKSLDIDYEYTLDSMVFAMSAGGEGMGGEEFALNGETGVMSARGLIRDGRMESAALAKDATFNLLKPMPMEVSFDLFDFDMGMPTEPSPKPQDIKYKIAAEGIELSDQIWAMMDPAGAFPRKLSKAVIDLEMKAMMMVSIFDPASMAEAEASGMPPMMPTSMKINSIAFDGLGLEIDANGEGELKGTVPDGKAFLSVKGLKDFVASARKMGMFGEQEAMMIEGMAAQMGKEAAGGALTFDVKTEGGMVVINGAPVAPIPGAQ